MYFLYDQSGRPYLLYLTAKEGSDPASSTPYYFILNLQGDVLYLADASGEPVASYTYDPYGAILTATGSLADVNPLRYRGYYYDTETGFYYLQSRYYDPTLGRFLNADSYASTGQGFLGFNMFAYCGNNSIIGFDPNGQRNVVCTRNMAHTDGANDRYYGTGVTKSETDRDRIKRIENGKGIVYLYNTKYEEITTKESSYVHPNETSPVAKGALSAADDYLFGVTLEYIGYSVPEVALLTAAYTILKTVAEAYGKDNSYLVPGDTYKAYEVYVSGYEKDSLTGLWIPFTACYKYAFVTDSHGTEYAILVDAS